MIRWRAWAINLLLVAVGTVVALGAAEIAVRVLTERTTATSRADRYGLPMHYPGITRRLPRFGTEVSFNSAGLRDREHSLKKPDGTFRILVLGDSFMEAYQVAFEESLSGLLEQSLNASGERSVEVVNAGVSGWGTDDELRFLTMYGLDYEPDLVLVAMTLHNDVRDNLRQWWHTLDADTLVALPAAPVPWPTYALLQVKVFLTVHFEVMQLLREVTNAREGRAQGDALATHVVRLFQDPMPDQTRFGFALTNRLVERVRDVAAGSGAATAVVLLPLEYQLSDERFADFVARSAIAPERMSLRRPQELVSAAADSAGIPVIDLLPAFRAHAVDSSAPLYLSWDGHWNEAGHRLAADVVVRELLERGLVR